MTSADITVSYKELQEHFFMDIYLQRSELHLYIKLNK